VVLVFDKKNIHHAISASVRPLGLAPKFDERPNIDPPQSSRLVAKFGLAAAVAGLSLLRFSLARLRRRCCRVNKAICRASESHAAKIPRPFFSRSGHGCICPATRARTRKAKAAAGPGTKSNGQLGARRWPRHRPHFCRRPKRNPHTTAARFTRATSHSRPCFCPRRQPYAA